MTIHRLIQRAAIVSTLGSTLVLSVVASPTVCFGQAQGATQDLVAPPVETGRQPVPCVVNADAVVVRSGGGENYYPTMKLDKGAKVTVVGHKFGWLKVIPPEGSFSYIGKAFVTRTGDGTKGTVNGTEVRVRAGSLLNEMVSIVQAQLNTGTEVEIIGEKNEFFLIKPPAGAYLYISEKYLDPIPQQPGGQVEVAQGNNGNAGNVTPPVAPPTDTTTTPPPTDTTTAGGNTGSPNVETLAGGPTTNPTTGGDALAAAPTTQPLSADAQFDALEAEYTAISAKRIEEQPIDDLIASYQKLISGNDLPESMKRIADVRVKMLDMRNEAKKEYEKALADQQMLADRRKVSDAEREELAEQIKKTDVTVYAAVGTLQTSSLQNGNAMLYRLTDPETARTIVYIRTNDATKYGSMIGKFVGVKGEVTAESALSMKVLVPTDAQEVDPNALYRTIASQIVPPSMLPKTANVPTE